MRNLNDPQEFYINLRARVSKRLLIDKCDEVLESVRAGYKKALQDEMVVLSRAENKRLLKQVAQELFEEVIKKL